MCIASLEIWNYNFGTDSNGLNNNKGLAVLEGVLFTIKQNVGRIYYGSGNLYLNVLEDRFLKKGFQKRLKSKSFLLQF